MGNKAENFRDLRIQPGERIRVGDVAQYANVRAFPDGEHAGPAVAFFIHRDNEAALEWREEEGAGSVGEMMLHVSDSGGRNAILVTQNPVMVQLLPLD